METLDLSKYRRTGEGANGASYDSLEDPTLMVKLYCKDYPTDTIFSELEVARKVYSIGVPSPEPGEMVTDGERIGIRFKKVVGKRSYSRALADEPERMEEYIREFARNCRELHKIECPEGLFPDAKPQFLHLLEADKAFNSKQQQVMADFIESVPEATTALHGDMHIGNVLTTLPKGAPITDPHDILFIDLGYFAQGYPLFDLGMTRSIFMSCDEPFRVENFHVTGELTRKCWPIFIDEYFCGKKTYEEADALVKPFEAVKMLLVEYNIGFMPDNYTAMIKETFGF